MGRQEEALRIAEELLTDIEQQRLRASEVVLKASRLARLVGHDDLTTFLSHERNGYPTDGSATTWVGRAGRWSESDEGRFFPSSIAKIEAHLAGAQESIAALKGGGNYSGDYITLAAREHDQRISSQAKAAGVFSGICGQVVATTYEMVAEIYHELLFSELQSSLFAETQTRVDGSLAEASGSALSKIEKVSERLREGDPESISQALTTCRRLIDSCADHVFPQEAEAYEISDGLSLTVGQQNVLNRLQAYTHRVGASKTRRDRLRVTVREIYSRCSAGTHAEVTVNEARFVFLQTYVVLGEILTLANPSPKAAEQRP